MRLVENTKTAAGRNWPQNAKDGAIWKKLEKIYPSTVGDRFFQNYGLWRKVENFLHTWKTRKENNKWIRWNKCKPSLTGKNSIKQAIL